jgi:hypothetical protein
MLGTFESSTTTPALLELAIGKFTKSDARIPAMASTGTSIVITGWYERLVSATGALALLAHAVIADGLEGSKSHVDLFSRFSAVMMPLLPTLQYTDPPRTRTPIVTEAGVEPVMDVVRVMGAALLLARYVRLASALLAVALLVME